MRDGASVAARERRFDAAFQAEFADLVAWRRDVRRFRTDADPGRDARDPVPPRRAFAFGRKLPADPLRPGRRRGPARRGQGEFRGRQPGGARRLSGRAGRALRQTEARRSHRGAGSSRRLLRRGRLARVTASAPARCRRRAAIPPSARSTRSGSPRAPTGSGSAGCRSSIPARLAETLEVPKSLELRRLSLRRLAGRGAPDAGAGARGLAGAHRPSGSQALRRLRRQRGLAAGGPPS